MSNRKFLLIGVLFLGLAFDLLFWQAVPGISFTIFVALCLALGMILLRLQGISPNRWSLVLLAPTLFFAAMFFFRREPLSTFLDLSLTLFCMALLALTYRSGQWKDFGGLDYLVGYIRLFFNMLSLPLPLLTTVAPGSELDNAPRQRPADWPVLRGILLALPIVLVFLALLSSADLIFAQRMETLLANLNLQKAGEVLFRAVYILVIAYCLAGIFTHGASRSHNTSLYGAEKPIVSPFLGMTEAAIILGSVLLLFTVFVAMQVQYFFSGQANITLEGFTYSEYARRGFGELLTVAFISLFLVRILSSITRRETGGKRVAFSSLVTGLVSLVMVIMLSSFQRLMLYEAAYGFSRLRAYSHLLIIWLAVLLLATVVLEWRRSQRIFLNFALLVILGFSATLNLMNVDAFIARQNIERTIQGEDLDVAYLVSLSSDAVPALVAGFTSQGIPDSVRDGVGAALACRSALTEPGALNIQTWRSFTVSAFLAERALEEVLQRLEGYKVDEVDSLLTVTSPNGLADPCQFSPYYD
jgi:hypothetical protein